MTPISLDELRHELLPGLMAVQGSYADMKSRWAAKIFNGDVLFVPAMPHIWIPKPVEVLALGAAATIIKNPEVTRRFWRGWFNAAG